MGEPKTTAFETELNALLSKGLREHATDSPDFYLATFLTGCVAAYQSRPPFVDEATRYGRVTEAAGVDPVVDPAYRDIVAAEVRSMRKAKAAKARRRKLVAKPAPKAKKRPAPKRRRAGLK